MHGGPILRPLAPVSSQLLGLGIGGGSRVVVERVNPIIPCRGAASALARASGFVIGVARCGLVQVIRALAHEAVLPYCILAAHKGREGLDVATLNPRTDEARAWLAKRAGRKVYAVTAQTSAPLRGRDL